jgi:hypothetical protein
MDYYPVSIRSLTPVPNVDLRWVCIVKGHGPFKWSELIGTVMPHTRGKCPECDKGGYRESMVIPATSYQVAVSKPETSKQGSLL